MQARLDELEQINEECSHTIDKYDRKLSNNPNNRRVSAKDANCVNENVQGFYH